MAAFSPVEPLVKRRVRKRKAVPERGLSTKWFDFPLSGTFPSGEGADTVKLINNIFSGPGLNQRIGNHVQWQALHLRGRLDFQIGALSIPSVNYCNEAFLRIVYDAGPPNTVSPPAASDMFKEVWPDGTTYSSVFSKQRAGTEKRILVLWEKEINGYIPVIHSPGGNVKSYPIDEVISLEGLITEYKKGVAVGAGQGCKDISTGALYLTFAARYATSASNIVKFSDWAITSIRLYYHE